MYRTASLGSTKSKIQNPKCLPGIYFVQNLYRVADLYFHAACAHPLLDPGEAARIAGGDDRGARLFDEFDFALQESGCHLRLCEVVDARAAAAGVCLLQ